MFYLLLGFVAGVAFAFALLARAIARNRRRIEALESQCGGLGRRQRAHGLVIRHLAEESFEPDEPEPPVGRPEFRALKGAAVFAGLWALVRRHPARAALASAAVAGVVLGVTLPTLGQATPPAAGLLGASSTRVAVSAQASTPTVTVSSAASTPAPKTVIPSIAATGSLPAFATSGAVSVAAPATGAPDVVSSAPTSPPSPSGGPPTIPAPTLTAPAPSPSGSPAQSCAVDLNLPPLLQLCVL